MGDIVKGAFNVAFSGLEVALDLLGAAYGLVSKTGDNAIETVKRQVKILREAVDQAIDGLG